MTGGLVRAARRLAATRQAQAIARLALADRPSGIEAEAIPDGVRLTGRGLRYRLVTALGGSRPGR